MESSAEDEIEVLERVEISDDEGDDYKYEAVEDLGFDEDEDEDEDIANALANLKVGSTGKSETAAMDSTAGYRSITQVCVGGPCRVKRVAFRGTAHGLSGAAGLVSSTREKSTTLTATGQMKQVRPSVVDDFIRNFMIKVGMQRTLDSFNTEWYELQAKGKLSEE